MLKDSLTLAALFFPLELSGTMNWNIFFCPRPLEFCSSETHHSWEPVMSLCIFPQGTCCGLTRLEWTGFWCVLIPQHPEPGPCCPLAVPSLCPRYPPILSYQGQQAQGTNADPQQPPGGVLSLDPRAWPRPTCRAALGERWGSAGNELGMLWVWTEDVLQILWGCSGGELQKHRGWSGDALGCAGDALGMNWQCTGYVLGMSWGCAGNELEKCRGCAGGALGTCSGLSVY